MKSDTMTLSSQKHVLLYFSITVSIHSSDSYFKRFPVTHAATQRSVLGCTHCRSTGTPDRCHPRTVLSQNSPPPLKYNVQAYMQPTLMGPYSMYINIHIYTVICLGLYTALCVLKCSPLPMVTVNPA